MKKKEIVKLLRDHSLEVELESSDLWLWEGNFKKVAKKIKNLCKKSEYVPYQLCPKCNGNKMVFVQNWDGKNVTIASGMQTCDICNGTGVIPMYKPK